jgi:BirA family biotin operon repressor/biotin-[acetyl-CoA-carboxylase] ligase
MDLLGIDQSISGLPIGPVRYLERLGSTNDEARQWATEGAPNLALVIAEEQTAGRGRQGKRWYTPPGVALAFSLVLRLQQQDPFPHSYLTGIGALGVCTSLQNDYSLQAKIKWPNDVFVSGKKAAGVLVETIFHGELLEFAILGIGINVARGSVPPASELDFPATCVEAELGRHVDRMVLLRSVLENVLSWLSRMEDIEFVEEWERLLAYRYQWVELTAQGREPVEGRLLGLETDGSVRLALNSGLEKAYPMGQIHLRKIDSD